jgi:hypothetical protein
MSTAGTAVEYRPIDGFPGYRVGSDGSVWSAWAYNGHQPRRLGAAWHQLRPQPDGDGYLALNLYRDGRGHRRKVHLLILEAFVGPRPAGMQGCHDNGNAADCSVGNLRWDTPTGNQRDRVHHNTHSRGTRSPHAKLSEDAVRGIRARLAQGHRHRDIAADFGVGATTISAIKSGRLWGWLAQESDHG